MAGLTYSKIATIHIVVMSTLAVGLLLSVNWYVILIHSIYSEIYYYQYLGFITKFKKYLQLVLLLMKRRLSKTNGIFNVVILMDIYTRVVNFDDIFRVVSARAMILLMVNDIDEDYVATDQDHPNRRIISSILFYIRIALYNTEKRRNLRVEKNILSVEG